MSKRKLEPGMDSWGHGLDPNSEAGFAGCFATREEAIADGLREYGGVEFSICRGVVPDPASMLPTYYSLMETVMERAYEEWGELAEGFGEETSKNDEAEKELMDFMGAWARKHIKITFWIVDETPETITAVDLAAPPFGITRKDEAKEPEAEPPVDS